jgi:hypothetical protein
VAMLSRATGHQMNRPMSVSLTTGRSSLFRRRFRAPCRYYKSNLHQPSGDRHVGTEPRRACRRVLHLPAMVREEFLRGVLTVIAVTMIAGCGGRTIEGSGGERVTGAGASSGGELGDASAGRIIIRGGDAGAGDPLGKGCVGNCPPVSCAPGYRAVASCCPSCEWCGLVSCPFFAACPAGEQPITAPGECCPSSCGVSGISTVLPNAGPCRGTAGPSMVRVPAPDGTTYCIDSTEVTIGQYAKFMIANAPVQSATAEPPYCSWNTTYTPSLWPMDGADEYPITLINWCDAFAYCKWAGKRLCGKIGGGPNAFVAFADATKSEWFNACSAGGTKAFPYGDVYDANACNDVDYSGPANSAPAPVASTTGCIGGYAGLYDMSGNVTELEDSCDGATGSNDRCRVRGGAAGANEGRCDDSSMVTQRGDNGISGFRCCAD